MSGNHNGGKRHRAGACQTIGQIHAPYNFVPLHDKIFEPAWWKDVSHDKPFRDGLSGQIDIEIVSHSPILIGNEHVPGSNNQAGEVHFHKAPDGRYMIPGSSLRGMVRNVLEIAAFGRMRFVNNLNMSVRDLTPGARLTYGRFLTKTLGPKQFQALAKSGWLTVDQGIPSIEPCEHSRVEHNELSRLGRTNLHFNRPTAASRKYDLWESVGNKLEIFFSPGEVMLHPHSRGKELKYSKADLSGRDATGTLVFTGQPGGSKHMEFIFYHASGEKIKLDQGVWKAFRQIHEETDEWKYWEARVRAGRKIPVFYLQDGTQITTLGLAQMFKLAYKHSIHDVIKHSSPEHIADKGSDLPALLFGYTDEDKGAGNLKGRVSFTPAFAQGNPVPQPMGPTILNGPKPSYFPIYLEQPQSQAGKLQGNSYVTCMDSNARIRGFKRYPARPQAKTQALSSEQESNKKVQVQLNPLPEGSCFAGSMKFHNLKPEELGALIWVLSWGGKGQLRHSIGMGRPFGFGQISIQMKSDLRPNDRTKPVPTIESCMQCFVECMKKFRSDWETSDQIVHLLAMADPAKASGKNLSHMRLSMKPQANDFVAAKNAHPALVLASYTGSLPAVKSLASSPNRQAGGGHTGARPAASPSQVPARKLSPAEIAKAKMVELKKGGK